MKSITIAGRLGKDATLRRTQGGDPVLGFSVAVDHRAGKEKSTMWFECAIWGKRGESLAQYLTKGTCVAVTGDLWTREYEGKTYLQVRVNDVTMLGGGERSGGQSADSGQSFSDDMDDSVPF
jgi:single-strand DNA-binding protein